jgi:PAS domain S-box-containing protein
MRVDIEWKNPASALSALGQHVGMWRWELSSNRVQWSDHLLSMLGLDRSDFSEEFAFFEALLHPEDAATVQWQIDRHLSTRAAYRFRCRLRHKDGHYITVMAQGSTIRDQDDLPVEMIGTVTDLSNEVRYAEHLAETERSFQSLADNVPGAIFRYVLDADGTDRVEYMSPGCFDIWEVTADAVESDASLLWSLVLDEDRPAMQASVAQSAETGMPWRHRWRIRTPSGKLKHVEGRAIPSRQPDGPVLWDSLILDVSQEVAVQKELISQQEMLGQAQKMESIGRIAGGIAHDFNNILAIVIGHAELAAEMTEDPELREYLEQIVDAAQRGNKLTRQLLSFARRSRLNPKVVSLDASVRSISALIGRVLPETISFNVVATAGLWKTRVDEAFLESAVLNLCINARDAMPDGGQLTIETSNVRVSQDYASRYHGDIAPGRYVLIAVTDTGTGIPAKDIEKVIEPFYSTKPPELGSGLGLAMVDGFVRQSNGALRIYSELGTGTTVKIYLPALDPNAVTASPDAAPKAMAASRNKGRILVVEDEPAILNILRITLERAGHSVSVASSGDEAMDLYGDRFDSFDLLLTDVVMPGKLQGPALASRLTEQVPSLPVVFMSGYPNEAAVHGNGIRPTDRFLMKPVVRETLLNAIDEALKTSGLP